MKIVVLVKQVPIISEMEINHRTFTVDRSKAGQIMNPADRNAIEAALVMKSALGGDVTVMTMGKESSEDLLRDAVAMGVDAAIRLTDDAFAGADTLVTAKVLAAAIQKIGPVDAVFCGSFSMDGATGQIPSKLGVLLHAGVLTRACELSFEAEQVTMKRKVSSGYESMSSGYPVICSVTEEINRPRGASIKGRMNSKKAIIPVYSISDLNLKAEDLISKSVIAGMYPKPAADRANFISGADETAKVDALIASLLDNQYI